MARAHRAPWLWGHSCCMAQSPWWLVRVAKVPRTHPAVLVRTPIHGGNLAQALPKPACSVHAPAIHNCSAQAAYFCSISQVLAYVWQIEQHPSIKLSKAVICKSNKSLSILSPPAASSAKPTTPNHLGALRAGPYVQHLEKAHREHSLCLARAAVTVGGFLLQHSLDLDPHATHQNGQTAATSRSLQELPETLGQRDKCHLEEHLFSPFPEKGSPSDAYPEMTDNIDCWKLSWTLHYWDLNNIIHSVLYNVLNCI